MLNEQISTVKIPLTPDEETEFIFLWASIQTTDLARRASVMLPSWQHTEGSPIYNVGGKKLTNTKGEIVEAKPGVERIHKNQLYRLANRLRADPSLGRIDPDLVDYTDPCWLGAAVCRDIVLHVHESFKSSSSNFSSRLWRTPIHRLLSMFNLWGWAYYEIESLAKKEELDKVKGPEPITKEERRERNQQVLKYASEKKILTKGDIIAFIETTRDTINHSNRPWFENLYPVPLHYQQVEVISKSRLKLKMGITVETDIQISHKRFRRRVEEVLPHLTSKWQESWLEGYLEGALRFGECKLVWDKNSDQWYLHITIKTLIEETWKEPTPEREVLVGGLHGGIYRPLSLTLINAGDWEEEYHRHYLGKENTEDDERPVKGKEMLHWWRLADDTYKKLQRKAREKHTRSKNGDKKMSNAKVSEAYSKASRVITRITRRTDNLLHRAISGLIEDLEMFEDCDIYLFYHDWTFIRDRSMRLKHLWGPERSKLPSHVRRIGALWPFAKITEWVMSRLERLPHVRIFPVPPPGACYRCSICGGKGRHIDDDRRFTHWHCWFHCDDCSRRLNADRNASSNLAWLAGEWVKKKGWEDPSKRELPKWVREIMKKWIEENGKGKKRKKVKVTVVES